MKTDDIYRFVYLRAAGLIAVLVVSALPSGVAADSGAEQAKNEREAGRHSPDNTGRNARDANDYRLTADDQPGGSDVEVLAKIRRAIVANDDLSVYGKNVKIIVQRGSVTLRGPVRSKAEAAWIGDAAKREAPGYAVLNSLEVADK